MKIGMYQVCFIAIYTVMARTTYQIFVQRDGQYGVSLSQFGELVRTATGFASVIDAQAWIDEDTSLPNADNPFRERDPVAPQGH
jgi:hypothetical protein